MPSEHKLVWVARYLDIYEISFDDCSDLVRDYIHPDTGKVQTTPFKPYYLSPVETDEEDDARE